MLPTGNCGKQYIQELTRLINAWVDESSLKEISLKAIMVMPALLLQKPSRESKVKDHKEALTRRLALWEKGDLKSLLFEATTIQHTLSRSKNIKESTAQLSKKFVKKMQSGNINGAIKLLSNNMENGVLPLNEETLNLLYQKHPDANKASSNILLPDQPAQIHSIRYEVINAEATKQAALKSKGGSGPSGMDSEGWRRILTTRQFGQHSTDLCTSLAQMAKSLCATLHTPKSIEPLLASRLIPLNKNPGLRPIGVGEVLRRIIGKMVAKVVMEDVTKSVGSLQVCAGHEAGSEAAIHAIRNIFSQDETEAVLLIDAANAFNSINREAFIHNAKVICPSIATFVENCYSHPARLFILGGREIKSSEGTTQGDPIAMLIYAIAIIPLLLRAVSEIDIKQENAKAVAFADDFTGAGKISGLKVLWDFICQHGPQYGYHPQPTKTWLIVKPRFISNAKHVFQNTDVQITTEGQKHLGAVIGSNNFKCKFITEKVKTWMDEISLLSKIAKFAPHESCICFTSGYKHKISYLMRTIPNMKEYLNDLDNLVTTEFIPSITGGIQVTPNERLLFSLPPSMGGLGIPIFGNKADIEFSNSTKLTSKL